MNLNENNNEFMMMNCAGVIVMNKNHDKTVLVKTHKGYHSYPKGKRHKGESYFETALREMNEETGLNVKDINIIQNIYIDETLPNGNPNIRYFLATFKNTDDFTFNFDEKELENVRWVTKTELYSLKKFRKERKDIFTKVLEAFDDSRKFIEKYKLDNDWKGLQLK